MISGSNKLKTLFRSKLQTSDTLFNQFWKVLKKKLTTKQYTKQSLWACLQCAVFIIKLPSKFISEQGISCGRKKNTSRMLHWKYTCTSPQHSPWDKKNCLLQWGGYFRGTRMLILLFFFFSKNSFGQKNCLLQHTNKCGLIIFLIKKFFKSFTFLVFLAVTISMTWKKVIISNMVLQSCKLRTNLMMKYLEKYI